MVNVSLVSTLYGDKNSKVLWLVTMVDDEDTEDTKSFFYTAENENQLFDRVLVFVAGVPYPTDEQREFLSDAWGIKVLFQCIGTIV